MPRLPAPERKRRLNAAVDEVLRRNQTEQEARTACIKALSKEELKRLAAQDMRDLYGE